MVGPIHLTGHLYANVGSDREAPEIAAISASGDRIDVIGLLKAELSIQSTTRTDGVYVSLNPDLNLLGIETDLWSVPWSTTKEAVEPSQQLPWTVLLEEFDVPVLRSRGPDDTADGNVR